MSSPSAEIDHDHTPSPWLPCPRCAGVWFKVVATLERGTWLDEETYTVDLETPPRVGAYVSGDDMIECNACEHKFSLEDVGYATESDESE